MLLTVKYAVRNQVGVLSVMITLSLAVMNSELANVFDIPSGIGIL